MTNRGLIATLAAVLVAAIGGAGQGRAQDVAEFYKGKTVILVAPDAVGGGYDSYARLVGRVIGDYIPGKPTVIVQNMSGAGGVIQANYLYTSAPKDGTTFALIQHGTIFRPLFDPREVRYKMDGFRYLGSVTPIVVIGAFNKDAPAKKAADLFEREVVIGVAGGTTQYLPQAINTLLKTKLKLVPGYRNTNDVTLAMKRGEVAGIVGIGLDSLQLNNKVEDFNILFQMGSVRAKELPNVPLIQEFANAADDREVLEAIFASFSIGRVFVTLQVPVERYVALQKAFEAAVKSPDLAEQARKQRSAVGYVSPQEIQKIVDHVYGLPEPILKQAAAAFAGAG
jgi:tripartite-type tricarboxylate transporter receptor subunit TctC